ncbi:PH domain-containing protein [Aliikangiella sp. G2MR2-5]|uniref:PH domain-containing protein n=1 Tax=Aliikangiella sp. G2MR2-5 TaxID=2788943 RepID=UPI0018A8FEF5|nr:PH domain-containing protein [Aliikangiella sp. G2MR2-5]
MSDSEVVLMNRPIDLDTIPSIANIAFSPLANKYAILSVLESLLLWIILAGGAFLLTLFKSVTPPLWLYFLLAPIFILSLVITYLGAKAKGYALREKDILYKRGIFWKTQTGVSFKRVQHIDLSNGPIERYFGLGSIKFFTAGGSHADLKISGLPVEITEKLRSKALESIEKQIPLNKVQETIYED